MFTDVVAMVGTGVSVASLGVGVYTLSRVRRVARAQSDERQLTQELLGVDQLELDLRRVISKLTEDDDRQAAALARDLSVKLGALQGVRRTLDPPARGQSGQVVRLEHGFFGQEFIIGELGRATSNIDIITGRTLLVNAYYVMDHIRQACARGVEVRLVSLDPEAGDGVIADAAQSVSNPAPVDVSDYRRQLVQNDETLVAAVTSWRPTELQSGFSHRVVAAVPRVSFLRADNVVNLGFLQLYRDAQPSEIRERPYIQLSANSDLGQIAMKHFESCWNQGRVRLPLTSEPVISDLSDHTDGQSAAAVGHPQTIPADIEQLAPGRRRMRQERVRFRKS